MNTRGYIYRLIKYLVRRNHQNITEEQKKENKAQFIVIVFVLTAFGIGFIGGYYTNERVLSGKWPWQQIDADPIPYLMETGVQTSEDVISFLARDKSYFLEYDPDKFVCRDFAETVRCQAKAEGMIAYAVVIFFDKPPHHMIVGLPADGDKFYYYEPTVGSIVSPEIGKVYMDGGKIIKALYYVNLKEKFIPIGSSPPYSEAIEKYM